ncbi:hypothetical protein ISF6_3486 [Piscinibacter sakaiensis]|uniref:JmjC domain-containing protein n=1 Tax=Piscinibacter sakaiensis TaxID=1547922 RepID=A0A0K8P4K6_PISS1|nr:hypothetical protein ISF6_3486 [Piscinibacter sakaiensis]
MPGLPPAPDQPLALLGGLSPARFMRRHWQKRPLLIRAAVDPATLPAAAALGRDALFALAAQPAVSSRLVTQDARGWRLRHGPFGRRSLPPAARPGWTLLVQGVDRHDEAAHALLSRFRFVPDARRDDLMVSYASDGGGVGPHVDSYDVFLLQLHGQRRWRYGPPGDDSRVPGLPLKILADFRPTEEALLAPGDMLYLPPGWGHEGVAQGECVTASVGFRAPARDELAQEVLQRCLDAAAEAAEAAQAAGEGEPPLYRDPAQPATDRPGEVPAALLDAAAREVQRLVGDRSALACSLGEWLSEPPPGVAFEPGRPLRAGQAVRLDRRTRMMWDAWHVFVNGESYRAGGRDARLMRRLADERRLAAADVARLGDDARALLGDWVRSGWAAAEPAAQPARRRGPRSSPSEE